MIKLSYLNTIALIFLMFITVDVSYSQSVVSTIYTDHNGFFTSSTSAPVTYDVNTQHLIAFRTEGTVWSTGVNDAVLTSNGVSFIPQSFVAMPATVTGFNKGAVIGIGRQFGGFTPGNGCLPAVTPPEGNNLSAYLTDGINGLDLSTAIFNIGGTINYSVTNISAASIGDGVPDIIVTQTGDLNGSLLDNFRFLNASNNLVGSGVDVNFSTVSSVAKPMWKFYNAQTLACGASSADVRDLRLLAFDFADLGITSANYSSVTSFEHILTPNSDIAFVAYNNASISLLPITLAHFDAELSDREEVLLSWETSSEIENDYFTIERSSDGMYWEEVLTQDGAGFSQETINYEGVDTNPLQGVSYYRLKQTDYNGATSFSNIVAVNLSDQLDIFPNPANSMLTIRGELEGEITFKNSLGQDVMDKVTYLNQSKNVTQLDVSELQAGYYYIVSGQNVYPIVIE